MIKIGSKVRLTRKPSWATKDLTGEICTVKLLYDKEIPYLALQLHRLKDDVSFPLDKYIEEV